MLCAAGGWRLVAGALPAEALVVPAGPVGEAVARAAGYAGQALSENTRRAYASDWRAFFSWCELGGVAALPAAPVVIAGHLASLAKAPGRCGLRRRLAAIAHCLIHLLSRLSAACHKVCNTIVQRVSMWSAAMAAASAVSIRIHKGWRESTRNVVACPHDHNQDRGL